jgi:hypothetical protein
MFHEPVKFVCDVAKFWANWATGGLLVLAISIWTFFKKQLSKKAFLFWLLIFWVLGCFSAWEDQRQRSINADSESDHLKKLLTNKSAAFDNLVAATARAAILTNSSSTVTLSNSPINQSVGPGNSGQVAQIAASPNAQVNFAPKPTLTSAEMVSNVFENGVFKATYIVTVDNPPPKGICLGVHLPSGTISATNIFRGGALDFGRGTAVPQSKDWIVITTLNKISEADVKFWITNGP